MSRARLTEHSLKGKVCIVTGGGSGIGRATCLAFCEAGANVICGDFNLSSAQDTARIAGERGGACEPVRADVGEEVDNELLVSAALDRWGRVDVFFANAGITGSLSSNMFFWDATAEDFGAILRVNTIGVFLGAKHAARAMRAAGTKGSIILTSSVAGIRSGAGGTAYSASKAAVVSIAQTCANQLAGTGIRVNAICPGLIETGMTKPLFEMADARGKRGKIGQLNPLRRYGEPSEIAGAAVFLASDLSSYVNGQALVVCGGLSSSHPIVPGRLS